MQILPSFMITTRFLAGSSIGWMFAGGSPSTGSRSARCHLRERVRVTPSVYNSAPAILERTPKCNDS